MAMPSVATRAKEHQRRWNQIAADPTLEGLPYKIETNRQGQLILSPHTNLHSDLQTALFLLLQEYAPDGHISVEYALATTRGVKAPDVVWMSSGRRAEMRKTGDPSTIAPEICVEVMSESNTEDVMTKKRALYREPGAEEVWMVSEEGEIRFFGDEERDHSEIAPDCPASVQP
jgi:Uma2 family endonuclease